MFGNIIFNSIINKFVLYKGEFLIKLFVDVKNSHRISFSCIIQ